MSLWCVMMVKDEADVIAATIRHVVQQGVDGILVSDNASTDGTREILADLELAFEAVHVIDDAEVGYWQSRKTTALATTAHAEFGAEWVWPCDADEIAFFDKGAPIADILAGLEDENVVNMQLYTHLATAVDPDDENPYRRMSYRLPDPQPLPKVIVRWEEGCVIHAGNHGADHPWKIELWRPGLRVAHCPYRNENQFVSKAINGSRAYAATDLPWSYGQHWREYGVHYERGGEEALRGIYREHFVHQLPSASGLVFDPIPILG